MRQQTNKDKDADRQKNANMTDRQDLKHKLFFAKLAKSQNKTKTNQTLFGVRIRDHDTRRIHVFTNLLYDSRILTLNAITVYVISHLL